MRWLVAIGLLVGGCYSPHLGSPSFYCHPGDEPACPEGQKCVIDRCVADDAKLIDLGTPNGVGSGGSADLASEPPGPMSMPDLASPAPQPDLAAPSCQPTGGPCPNKNNAICCSKYCIYSSSTCK